MPRRSYAHGPPSSVQPHQCSRIRAASSIRPHQCKKCVLVPPNRTFRTTMCKKCTLVWVNRTFCTRKRRKCAQPAHNARRTPAADSGIEPEPTTGVRGDVGSGTEETETATSQVAGPGAARSRRRARQQALPLSSILASHHFFRAARFSARFALRFALRASTRRTVAGIQRQTEKNRSKAMRITQTALKIT